MSDLSTIINQIITLQQQTINKIKTCTRGQKGQPGHTPVRGVDYWTEQDKQQIKDYVADAILNGKW